MLWSGVRASSRSADRSCSATTRNEPTVASMRPSAVNVVDAIAAHGPLPLAAIGQVKVTCERVAGLAVWPVGSTCATPAAATHVPSVVPSVVTCVVSTIVAQVVAIEHAGTPCSCGEYGPIARVLQFIDRRSRRASGGGECCVLSRSRLARSVASMGASDSVQIQ